MTFFSIPAAFLIALILIPLAYGQSDRAQGVAGQPDPYVSVQESTDLLLAKLKELQPIFESDPQRFYAEVEQTLLPYIDFDGFSKRVMAKYYRLATEEQRQQFEVKFRKALIHTYASALVEFDNEKVVVQEPTNDQRSDDRASIILEIHTSSGAVYPVEYQLSLEGDKWLLYNVVINGINIGLQFRSQFNADMQKYRKDISQ
ncbi:MAG: ABC transporter substrate-binding protein, partial [Proteobacteria bacterium]|nr:ABC transporter substrate-binding protein [Pseudomonadota bacterium]